MPAAAGVGGGGGRGLVRVEHARGAAMGECAVVLTATGRDALAVDARAIDAVGREGTA